MADSMLRHPTVHPVDLTVGEARSVLDARPKTRVLLLVEHGMLVSVVTRDDLAGADDDAALAITFGSLDGRTVAPDAPIDTTREQMARERRVAVVAADGRLLGLLCLKRSGAGFCTDEGVAQMRRDRAALGPPAAS